MMAVNKKWRLERCLIHPQLFWEISWSPSYLISPIYFSSQRQEVGLRSMVWQAGCRFKASKNQTKVFTSATPKISMVQHTPLQDWKSLMVFFFYYLDVKNIKMHTSRLQRMGLSECKWRTWEITLRCPNFNFSVCFSFTLSPRGLI